VREGGREGGRERGGGKRRSMAGGEARGWWEGRREGGSERQRKLQRRDRAREGPREQGSGGWEVKEGSRETRRKPRFPALRRPPPPPPFACSSSPISALPNTKERSFETAIHHISEIRPWQSTWRELPHASYNGNLASSASNDCLLCCKMRHFDEIYPQARSGPPVKSWMHCSRLAR
jgi:hypothetical protein